MDNTEQIKKILKGHPRVYVVRPDMQVADCDLCKNRIGSLIYLPWDMELNPDFNIAVCDRCYTMRCFYGNDHTLWSWFDSHNPKLGEPRVRFEEQIIFDDVGLYLHRLSESVHKLRARVKALEGDKST